MLRLRRGRVASVYEADDRIVRLVVDVDGVERDAVAYPGLTGGVEVGDEVIVNVEARDLGLGSGGFDIVHANLTRGLDGEGDLGAHVMKLNYTPIQHAVAAIEDGLEQAPGPLGLPVAVLALHGQLAPAAFAAADRAPGARIGYVQTAGGALPGALSHTVAELRRRGALCDHVTVAPCFGGEREAITVEGALHAATARLGWDAAVVGPGPGILGSASAFGHGELEALHVAHSARALGCRAILAPRLSSGDPRERHRGLSHHTQMVLSLLLRAAAVAVPDRLSRESQAALDEIIVAGGHEPLPTAVADLLDAYANSGLPLRTMGRALGEDEDFFAAALAAGAALAEAIGDRRAA